MNYRSPIFVAAAAILLSAEAFGGTVSFDPAFVVFDPASGDEPIVEIDVAISSIDSLQQFDGFDVVIGSHSGVEIVYLTLSPEMIYLQACKWGCFPAGLYPSDLSVGAFGFFGSLYTPFPLGTLTVDASGLGPGTYEILVDYDFDERSVAFYQDVSGIETEPLYGVGTIQIIPEPGTLAVLGLGSLVAVHRRRQRRVPGVRDGD